MIKKIYKKYEIIFNVIFFSIFPITAFYLMEFYEHNPFEEVRFMAGFFNIILFELIAWILYFVTGRAKWALRAVFIVAMVFGLINHYVMLFRSTPFVPWDIFSIGTATSVASNYDFAPTAGVVVVTVIFIALIMLMHFVDFRIKWKFRFRLIPTVLGILALCLFVNALQDEDFQTDNYLYPFLFTPAYMTKVNRLAVTFAMDLKFVAVDKPDGYSRQKAKELLDSYAGTDDNTAITDKSDYPNIIVVMDEAFSDLSVLGEFDTNEDYMPFVHSLQQGADNTVTGMLNVSVCGGNTANTEFEILTGMTLDYFGAGEYPYKTVLQDETCESMAYNLRELGYRTGVLHNNTGSFYSRNKVFANLGFDYFVSSEYMENLSYNPIGWAKDKVLTGQIQHILKATSEPDLIYTITVQDHGKYPTELLENPHIKVSGFAPEDEGRQNAFTYYVNQCHETDAFLGSLIATLNAFEEPVVLVLYGDHLPNLDITEEELASGNLFQTEYVIWSNKKMLEDYELSKKNENLYAYQLSAHVLKLFGMNNGLLTKFHQMYHNYDNYKSNLKILQYDMLYGKKEVYDGLSPYEPTDLQMGFDPIRITDVSSVGGSVYVMGKNFTESSFVFIDGKKQDTVFLNENTLMVSDKELEGGEEVYVAQLTEVSAQLSSTEVFIYGD